MSVLYIRSDTKDIKYSDYLLEYIEAYDVDLVICAGDAGLAKWCGRWMLKTLRMVPHSKAMDLCDACVVFTSSNERADRISSELYRSRKPFVIYVCDNGGKVLYARQI